MISTVSELCDKALEYILSVPVKNKNVAYTPSGTLKKGAHIKTFSFNITCPGINQSVTKTANLYVDTGEDIPSAYLAAASTDKIKADWNDYKNKYILTKLTSDTYVSISSLFAFLYLFRFFIDKKFCLFTDIYTLQNVWLYNTGTISAPQNMNIDISQLNMTNMNSYMSTLINQIMNRDNLKVLKAASSTNSCSSSSCSSSCSSSSSSSSSSCSSSSSSLFIAFFNIG